MTYAMQSFTKVSNFVQGDITRVGGDVGEACAIVGGCARTCPSPYIQQSDCSCACPVCPNRYQVPDPITCQCHCPQLCPPPQINAQNCSCVCPSCPPPSSPGT